MAAKSIAVIAGSGPGIGASVARIFVKNGYDVALLARTKSSLDSIAQDINSTGGGSAQAFTCDVTDGHSVKEAFKSIKSTFKGPLKVAVFNAPSNFVVKSFLDVTENEYNSAWNVNGMGAFHFSQEVIKELLANQGGTLIFTGATASIRAGPRFSALAATKFSLRALSQSLAKEFGPKNVHVAHAIIDGGIQSDRAIRMLGAEKVEGERLNPDHIAEAYFYLHHQPKTAWTWELDLRPSIEKW